MLRKIQYVCLVGSIALIGADRIDFFAGHGPFILTPFLVLASLVVGLSLVRTGSAGLTTFKIVPAARRQFPFIAATSLFLLLAFASIPFSLDPDRSVVAFLDLLVVSILGYCIAMQILTDSAQEKLIVRSVTVALIIYGAFCVAECIAWSHGVLLDATRSGSWLESTFAPSTIGPWVPTLSGTTFDNNRSGFVLTMYLALLDRFAAKSRRTTLLRWAIGVLVFLTLSRSGTICWLAYYLSSKSFWVRLASRRVLLRVAALAVLLSLVGFVYQTEIVTIAEAWEISDAVSTKLSMDPGSSGESHILLIRRGLETWLTSPRTVVAGIGYAAAPKVLEDFFGNDKRGNFHSLYVTALAEMGLPAFLVLMFLLGYPIIGRKGVFSCMVAIMIFNVSYQSQTEPVFWMVLALVWSYEPKSWRIPAWLAAIRNAGDRNLVKASP